MAWLRGVATLREIGTLRPVEEQSHGSPWHELASSDVVKRAMKEVPGFADQVVALAGTSIKNVAARKNLRNKTSSSGGTTDE